jgi:hypothetical protein
MRLRKLRAGDWVEVRSKEEILKTLDRNGELDGMPFMPEMLAFCGKRFPVYKRAHKTCDTVVLGRGRRVDRAFHLHTRCDGAAHGGCEATCLIFWKEAWLKPISANSLQEAAIREDGSSEASVGSSTAGCTEAVIWERAQASGKDDGTPTYVCQATRLPYVSTLLPWWDIRQYVEDYASGNVGLAKMAKGFAFMAYRHGLVTLGIGIGPAVKWIYDIFQRLRGGTPYPHREGQLPIGGRTPATNLGLQPGEWVRVKSFEAIRKTCDASNRNRGLGFDGEMVPYCGGVYRVLKRVTKIINEKTGKMQEMKNPCIILEGVVCQARYSDCRLFCPRSIYPYWREIWLERVDANSSASRDEAGAAEPLTMSPPSSVR